MKTENSKEKYKKNLCLLLCLLVSICVFLISFQNYDHGFSKEDYSRNMNHRKNWRMRYAKEYANIIPNIPIGYIILPIPIIFQDYYFVFNLRTLLIFYLFLSKSALGNPYVLILLIVDPYSGTIWPVRVIRKFTWYLDFSHKCNVLIHIFTKTIDDLAICHVTWIWIWAQKDWF